MTLLDSPRTADRAAALSSRDLVAALDAPPLDDAPVAARPGFEELRGRLQTWLREWDTQRLPAFEQARTVTPDGERTSALRAATTRADGAVRITASLYDAPNRQGEALAWAGNWVTAYKCGY